MKLTRRNFIKKTALLLGAAAFAPKLLVESIEALAAPTPVAALDDSGPYLTVNYGGLPLNSENPYIVTRGFLPF